MEEQQELRLEVQRRTNLVEETQKPDDETTPSTATSFVPRLTTGMVPQCCQQLAISLIIKNRGGIVG